jgi:ATP-dependent exoDNAse (exonuclease V) beta subunit
MSATSDRGAAAGGSPASAGKDTGARRPLADDEPRRLIREELEKNLVVEAAAGTGKTTVLVRRIVEVLACGLATVDRIVAVTFTEKAAGELKLRLRSGLEEARREAGEGERHRCLEAALARLEEARVGTIHSFCADLLRERSIEAGVDPRFEPMTEPEAERLFGDAFRFWLQEKLKDPPEGVRRSLRRTAWGSDEDGPIGRLRRAGWTLVEWRDFPAPWRRPPFDRTQRIDDLVDQLHAFADLSGECADRKRDNLFRDTEAARRLSREIRTAEEVRDRDYDGVEARLVDLSSWKFAKPRKGRGKFYAPKVPREKVLEAHADLVAELEPFARDADADLAALLRAELREAVDRYEKEKQRTGRLDFLDLLLRTRDLVRHRRDVRADFQRRFTHLFVDEFQDTDPLQAEILLLLSADDPQQEDWRAIVPEPGKLFLVGDPKQSIYRFRRADVGIYLEVRDRLVAQGARRVDLTTSFRSAPGIQRVINASFEGLMDGDRTTQQASWVPLTEFRSEPEGRPSVVVLPVPAPYGRTGRVTKGAIQESLPDATAAYVDWLLNESGWTVTERDRADEAVPLAPRHICLLFRRFDSWWAGDVTRGYVDALEARNIRHLLVGGRSFHEREEVETLRTALTAIERPDDELSVFATLKGPLFAVGDEELLEYRHHEAGKVRRLMPFRIPPDLPERLQPIADGLKLLGKLHRDRNRRPIAETVHRLLEATRAHATFVMRPSGEQALANVLHVAEQARLYERTGGISFRGFVERLIEDAGARKASEAPILEEGSEGVRLMTVHRAKGLEFPVVILADISADAARNNASRAIDGELCAVRIAGWAPADLLDREADEVERDRAEGVRLAYVAATRARDLLVIPGLGDGPWGNPDGDAPGSWTHPLNRAIYPPFEAWKAAEAPEGCPPFGTDTVHDRPHDPEGETGIRPGRHEVGGAAVTWWDPGALQLGKPIRQGVRHQALLSSEVDDATVAADVERFREWERSRERTLNAAAAPSLVVRTAREHAVVPDVVDASAVDVVRLEREKRRPKGTRFGALVHAVLATVPMNATEEGVRSSAEMQGRVLGAPSAEVRAAAVACTRALSHALLARAREAAQRGDLRRETPVSRREADGVLVEGVADLAFRDIGGWTVVDFKTDQEIDTDVEVYRRQVALYASMISTATGQPAQAVLLVV